MKKLLSFFIAAILLTNPAMVSAAPQSLRFDPLGAVQKENPVEQQTDSPWNTSNLNYVINPTQCSWDVDDHWTKSAFDDYLNPGIKAVDTSCTISETTHHYITLNGTQGWWATGWKNRFSLYFYAKAPLQIKVTFSPQNKTVILGSIFNAVTRNYEYKYCGSAIYSVDDMSVIPINNSNGSTNPNSQNGVGVRTDITVEIENTGTKQVKGINGTFGMTGTGTTEGCNGALIEHIEYPMTWYTFN